MCDCIDMVGFFLVRFKHSCYKIIMIPFRLNELTVPCIIGVFNSIVVTWRGEWWFIFDFDRISVFEDDIGMFDPLTSVIELIGYVDRLASVGLALENDHNILLHFTLSFYELVNVTHALTFYLCHYLYHVKTYLIFSWSLSC